MIAPLSYKSEYGYYGLRVNPSYDQVLGTVRKPLGIPLPERKAKWYALGPYRDLLLHAQERIDAAEESAINYRKTSKLVNLPQLTIQSSSTSTSTARRWKHTTHTRRPLKR